VWSERRAFLKETPMQEWHTDAQTIVMALGILIGLITNYFATLRGIRKLLVVHEKEDQKRHVQNLQRFSWIGNVLARMGNQSDMPTFED
jgi:hypothetical protein